MNNKFQFLEIKIIKNVLNTLLPGFKNIVRKIRHASKDFVKLKSKIACVNTSTYNDYECD